jgi:hypothetical protein
VTEFEREWARLMIRVSPCVDVVMLVIASVIAAIR